MLSKLLHVLTIWSLFFTQVAFALDVQLEQDLTIQQKGKSGRLEVIAKLPKGSIVTIPDLYIGNHFTGDKRSEVALLNWIKYSGGTLKLYTDSEGTIRNDYFFPIKVVSTPDKSIAEGFEGEVSLRYLARQGDLKFVTVAETPVHQDTSKPQTTVPPAQNDCFICGQTQTPNPISDTGIFKELTSKLQGIFSKIDADVEKKVEAKKYPDTFIKNFNATCGMSFDKFLPMLKEESLAKGIPPEIMLGMMSVESSGRCDAILQDANGTYSVGLFQINTSSSKKSFAQLKDPIENMRESLRILVDKYKKVNAGKSPASKTAVKLMTDDEKTLWRKALSAYNGGEGHLFQSEKDLLAINKKYGLSLDPENWEERKVFYFRKFLEKNTSAEFENKHKYKRSTTNSMANIVYVESVLGDKNGKSSIIDSWYPELIKISTVAENKSNEDELKKRQEEERRRLEEERKRQIEEQRRLEEERKRAEEEKKRLEEEQRKREEEQRRLEEERKRLEEERKRKEEERRRFEEEKKRREEEARLRLEEERKRAEEERRRLEEERRRAEEERKLAEEEKRKQDEEAKRLKEAEEALKDFVLKQEQENKKKQEEFERLQEEFEYKQKELFLEYQEQQEEEAKNAAERERLEKIRLEQEEVMQLNSSGKDFMPATLQNVYRTTILGVARLKYHYKFRNQNSKYYQKCTVLIKSFYNQVNDVDEHTFIVPPGGSKEITGTLSKPWIGQGAKAEKDCEFLPPDYKEPARAPAYGSPYNNR